MESFATAYPVIFHDGEQELDKGHIGVHSVLSFKKFQAQMSRLVGVPANQLSTVLVCRKTVKDGDKRQKLPINETTNFNIILNQHNPSRERNCHFLVSIKKSKKERKGTRKRSAEADNGDDEDSNSSRGDVSPLEERPKQQQHDSIFSESTSPTSILQRPLSPAGSPSDNQESSDNTTRKVLAGTTEKVERILLRREAVSSSSSSSQNTRVVATAPQRVEGFNLVSSAPSAPQQWNRPLRDSKVTQPNTSAAAGEAFPPQRFNDAVLRPGRAGAPLYHMQNASANRLNMQSGGGGVGGPAPGPVAAGNIRFKAPSLSGQLLVDQVQKRIMCRDCENHSSSGPPAFHWCINDRILVGFRRSSPAGPIQRPTKRHAEA